MQGKEERKIWREINEEDREVVETLIEERRYGDREEQDEGQIVMEGWERERIKEWGEKGYCWHETMKKNEGRGREGKCVLAIREKTPNRNKVKIEKGGER